MWTRCRRGLSHARSPRHTARTAVQFTIVGRDGTKIVTGTTERFLSQTFTLHAPARVVEVPAVPASMTIAIEGAHADATWIGLGSKDRSLRVKGTAIEVVIGYEGRDPVTTLQRDGQELGRYTGRAIGVVAVGGARRLVLVDGARTTSHALP